jgi:SNF2 family DNA or RNA helicase
VLLELLEQSGELPSLRSLQHRNDAFIAVPIADQGYLRVEPERLKRLFDVLVELYESSQGKSAPAFPANRVDALERLPQELQFTAKEGTELPSFNSAFLKPPAQLDPADLPVKATLRPYQVEGVSWLQHLTTHAVGGILADDMGLGKTLQTITHLALEHTGNPLLPPSLIVCPTSLVGNWKRELLRFAPQLRVAIHHGPDRHAHQEWLDGADIIITTYPILLRDESVFEPLDVHLLVLDEAQAIKSSRGSLHKAVKAIKASHRLCLTGTPIENHLGELWSLFDFLEPGWLGDETSFRARYRDKAVASLADRSRLESLHHRVAPYVLRRLKEQVAPELPPKITTVVPIEIGGKQRELYEAIRSAAHDEVRRAIKQKGIGGSTLQVLDALMKLRQVCCDPRLVNMEAARFVKASAKLDKLVELLETHLECKRRVLIFSQFTSMLSLIERTLHDRDIDSLVLTGQTENRQARVDAFERGQADVFLISLKAGGTGLNLTSADTVIHYDPWWNPAAQDQATDRAYRIGQKRSVLVQQLLISGSVEERMCALQAQKRELAKSVLEGEGEAQPLLTEQSVNELFAPIDA